MKAIETKYLGATNYRGARIKAKAEGGNSITISYPYEYDPEQAHRIAAQALQDKMNWPGEMIGGGTEQGYAWVFKAGQLNFD